MPLLLGGDEFNRTQRGNNNAHCQDNAISWVDWAAADAELVEYVTRLRPDATPMDVGDWSNPDARTITVAVADGALVVSAWCEPLVFRLPHDGPWTVELDTPDPDCRRVAASRARRPLAGAPQHWGVVTGRRRRDDGHR
jgi:glycogen operon protein